MDDYPDKSLLSILGKHEQNDDVGTFVVTEKKTMGEKEENNVIKNPYDLSVGDKFNVF